MEVVNGEGLQLLWLDDLVLDDKPGHGTTAAFGVHGDGLELQAFVNEKQRFDDGDLLQDLLPVTHPLKLCCGEIEENAVVVSHLLDEDICEPVPPPGLQRLAFGEVQSNVGRHAVEMDAVEGSEKTIEKRHRHDMILGEREVSLREVVGLEVFISLTIVSQ